MPSPPTGTTPPSTAPADRDQQAASRHLRPSISSPPANTSSHHTKATLRRPSHFNYSDPDAAAAASFCADKDYISAAPSSVINAGPQSPDGRPRRKSSATLPIMDLPSLTTGYEDSDRAHAAPFRFDDDESQVGGSIESLGGDINRPLLYSQDNQHEPIRRKSTKAKIQFKSRRVPSSGSDKNEGKVRPAPVPLQSGDVSHRWVSQERIDSSQSGRSGNEKDDRDDIYEEGSDDDEEDDTSASSDFGPDYEAIGDLLGSKPDDGGDKLTKGLDRKKVCQTSSDEFRHQPNPP
ncbi:hypothetical protein DFS34DRAFT_426497 [Phlyctochytrium arcticum]|nr:hypothetical protein DFS34DRAFT_426497 [Phlyctochytrium arcticum]